MSRLDRKGGNWLIDNQRVDADEFLALAQKFEAKASRPSWLIFVMGLVVGVVLAILFGFLDDILGWMFSTSFTFGWAAVLIGVIFLIRWLYRRMRTSDVSVSQRLRSYTERDNPEPAPASSDQKLTFFEKVKQNIRTSSNST